MPIRPYETLIRHNADGSLGAHHQQIREVLDGNEIVAARVLDPIPLAIADGQHGLALSAVLGEATALALLRNAALEADLQTSQTAERTSAQQLDAAHGRIGELETLLSQAQEALAAAQARIAQLEGHANEPALTTGGEVAQ